MENYIKKLFKQYPFIYKINDEYYAFGVGVCEKCAEQRRDELDYRYGHFCDNISADMYTKTAWRIFRKLNFIAERLRDKNGYCVNSVEKIKEYNFGDKELAELEIQVKRYIQYWRDYNLADMVI